MVNRRAREIREVGMKINAFEFLLSFSFFIFVFRLSKRLRNQVNRYLV
jgi:hypothetical protein